MARRKWDYETIQKALDGENVSIQSGYTGKDGARKVGDEWTDAKGILWKKTENGVVRVNKQADLIRELVRPKCSVCNLDISLFGDKVDEKIFARTGKCFSCLEIEEQTLKVTGKYEEYELQKMFKNKLGALKDFKQKVTEAIEFLKNDTGITADTLATGEQVVFRGKCNPQWLIDAEADLVKVNKEIEEITDVVSKFQPLCLTTNKT